MNLRFIAGAILVTIASSPIADADDTLSVINKSDGQCTFFIKASKRTTGWNEVALRPDGKTYFPLVSKDTFDIACRFVNPFGEGTEYQGIGVDLHAAGRTPDGFPLPFSMLFTHTATKAAGSNEWVQVPATKEHSNCIWWGVGYNGATWLVLQVGCAPTYADGTDPGPPPSPPDLYPLPEKIPKRPKPKKGGVTDVQPRSRVMGRAGVNGVSTAR